MSSFVYRFWMSITTGVDLQRPKMLIMLLHKLNLRKNTSHTSFILFSNVVSSSFKEFFSCFGIKVGVLKKN